MVCFHWHGRYCISTIQSNNFLPVIRHVHLSAKKYFFRIVSCHVDGRKVLRRDFTVLLIQYMHNYTRPPLLKIPPTVNTSSLHVSSTLEASLESSGTLWSQTNPSQPPCTHRVVGIPHEPPGAPKPQRKRTFDDNTPVRPNEKRRRKNQLGDDTFPTLPSTSEGLFSSE